MFESAAKVLFADLLNLIFTFKLHLNSPHLFELYFIDTDVIFTINLRNCTSCTPITLQVSYDRFDNRIVTSIDTCLKCQFSYSIQHVKAQLASTLQQSCSQEMEKVHNKQVTLRADTSAHKSMHAISRGECITYGNKKKTRRDEWQTSRKSRSTEEKKSVHFFFHFGIE